MIDIIKIKEKVLELEDKFIYKEKELIYDEKVQEEASRLLEEIAILTRTFDNNIKSETDNIKKELTIIDTTTGQKIELVDSKSLNKRVKDVLKENNIYTCLKFLALSNKIAHAFDIDNCSARFTKYYNKLYPNEITNFKDVTFFEPLYAKYPKIIDKKSIKK